MNSLKFSFVFLITLLSQPVFPAAVEIPVLLRLSRAEQVDTNGCNFVEEITSVIYKEIVAGRVKLWDSPAKEIQITGITLQELEKNSGTSFTAQEIIYIYELWQSSRKLLTSSTLGFNFSNKNPSGEDVAYGFVEYSSLRDLFLRTRINTNANGDYSSTYASYVNNKTYNYNIIQFNGKVISDVNESIRIRREFIGNQRFNAATFVFNEPDRHISYTVENNSTFKSDKSDASIKLLSEVESYLTENQEIFYNYGGDKILSYFQKNLLKVTRLDFTEIWRKTGDSITMETRSMVVFVNDSALSPISMREMIKMEIKIGEESLAEFIRKKQFSFVITQINSQKIGRKDAFLYYKALVSADWRRLTEYVKDF